MSRRESKRVVKDLYAAFGRGNIATVLALLAEDGSRGRVKSTGRMFDNHWVMAFSVRDGKIIKFEEYADTQALATAHDVNSHAAGGAGSA